MTSASVTRPAPDLRAVTLAVLAWAGGLAGFLLPRPVAVGLLAAAGVALGIRHLRGRPSVVAVAWLAAAAAVAVSAMVRADGLAASPVARLAQEHAYVRAEVRVTSDPALRQGEFGPYVVLRASTQEVVGRGRTYLGRVPVLVLADPSWSDVELGSTVRVDGRTSPAAGGDLAAVVSTTRDPIVVEEADGLLDGAAAVRAGIRTAVQGAGEAERSLVPALVVGDDRGMPAELQADFRSSGLTHLLAVSGTNLTLVVGSVLVLARWTGVRARGLVVVGLLGVVGFVLLARTEPSVVRAAAMGAVALVGLGSNGRERGARALGVAVLLLLLVDPWLVLSVGFALSALATAGILFLAPPWRDALGRWMPRWLAEAVAVPLAAQLACTPVVAAISGQVSLVAVVANIAVAPAVGPATVLGLAGGLVVLVLEPVGELVGRAGAWCAWWITTVADRASELPSAAVAWSVSAVSIGALGVVCVVVAAAMPRLLVGPVRSCAAGALMVASFSFPLPTPGWPPTGWLMVACDVGQGDGLALNAGGGAVLLVDVGPDPSVLARCLDRLGAESVLLVVLTHFHDDHVAGLPALRGERMPEEVLVTALADPVAGAEAVTTWAAAHDVPVRVPPLGEVRRAGSLTWQVVGPTAGFATGKESSEGSPANNASIVLLVEARGVRILLTGDMEPEAQEAMHRSLPALRVDVVKVPHHGSRYQDQAFLSALRARVALVSVGEDNTYGHPAPGTVDRLEDSGTVVRRTDVGGDIAVVVRDGELAVVTQSRS